MDCNFVCTPSCKALPEVSFDVCAPQIYAGQVTKIYLSTLGHYLLDELDPDEWATRLALGQSDPSKIIMLSGIGDKPEAEKNDVSGPMGIVQSSNKIHKLNFAIRELGDTNYNMMRRFEVTKKALLWFESSGGKMFGGKGIPVTIDFNDVIPEDYKDLERLVGLIQWEHWLHPCRNDAVI